MKETNRADVVIVGAGIMGLSAAWQLAGRHLKVVVLEQFATDHSRGSSHGASRIFRLAYDRSDYVRLAATAQPLWREMERELGVQLLQTTGGLDIGPPELLAPVASALESGGARFSRLTNGQLARGFPAYSASDCLEAIHQPDAGVLLAEACRRGARHLAVTAGAEIRPFTHVTCIEMEADGVAAHSERESWRAERLIVGSAAWTEHLLSPLGLGVPLIVTREHVAYFRRRNADDVIPFMWHSGPTATGVGLPAGSRADSEQEGTRMRERYGLPNARPDEIKIGDHGTGPVTDARDEGYVEEWRVAALSRFVQERLPAVDPSPVRAETCLYASTPDDDFVVDRIGPIVLAVGFGGHGFKFAPLVGKMVAELVMTGAASHPRFRLERFAAGSAVS
jgi:sarcosine oxidase